MNSKSVFVSALAAGLLLSGSLFTSCNFSGNRTGTDEPSATDDTAVVAGTASPAEEVRNYTLEEIDGIYDSEDGDRYTFSTDGTGTSGRIGSLFFTDFEYTIEGDEIVIKWDEESQSRLKIQEDGQAICDPGDDLVYQREKEFGE